MSVQVPELANPPELVLTDELGIPPVPLVVPPPTAVAGTEDPALAPLVAEVGVLLPVDAEFEPAAPTVLLGLPETELLAA